MFVMLFFHHVVGVNSGDIHLFVQDVDGFWRRVNILGCVIMEVLVGIFLVKCRMRGRFIGDSGFDQK